MLKDDWSACPSCDFPALYSELKRFDPLFCVLFSIDRLCFRAFKMFVPYHRWLKLTKVCPWSVVLLLSAISQIGEMNLNSLRCFRLMKIYNL